VRWGAGTALHATASRVLGVVGVLRASALVPAAAMRALVLLLAAAGEVG
jgi:hypothetical protein